jgi:hypothetical protein
MRNIELIMLRNIWGALRMAAAHIVRPVVYELFVFSGTRLVVYKHIGGDINCDVV